MHTSLGVRLKRAALIRPFPSQKKLGTVARSFGGGAQMMRLLHCSCELGDCCFGSVEMANRQLKETARRSITPRNDEIVANLYLRPPKPVYPDAPRDSLDFELESRDQ
jgi:hypothetical protein